MWIAILSFNQPVDYVSLLYRPKGFTLVSWTWSWCRYSSTNGPGTGQPSLVTLSGRVKQMNLCVKTTWQFWNCSGKLHLVLCFSQSLFVKKLNFIYLSQTVCRSCFIVRWKLDCFFTGMWFLRIKPEILCFFITI